MIFKDKNNVVCPLREKLNQMYRTDEQMVVENLIASISLTKFQQQRINNMATHLVEQLRQEKAKQGGLNAFLSTYDLSTDEGIALMCIAEAMLRIPDAKTVDSLIQDKLSAADWQQKMGKSDSTFVNLATWSLMLTGKIIEDTPDSQQNIRSAFKKLTKRAGEPLIRKAVSQAMKILGKQFVMGRTIEEGLVRGKKDAKKGYTHSYDMLGEAARTEADAARYFNAYRDAIIAIGEASKDTGIADGPGISIKLSALYPRYEFAQQDQAVPFLIKQLTELALLAKQYNIGLTVDAEEANRLDVSLDIIEAVFLDKQLDNWEGFGLAVQAYQKRAFYLLDWLQDLSERAGKKLMVRLVKGAYWDSEIKDTQEQGYADYPVFTRKVNTDVSYLACAHKMLQAPHAFYAQFATHNPQTLSVIMELVSEENQFEFQCLHGMGQSLYDAFLAEHKVRCRIYAPIGSHEDLLPYLVRRLLENGANSSFINMIGDKNKSIESIIADPLAVAQNYDNKRHSKIPLPADIYGTARKNSAGIDLDNRLDCQNLETSLAQAADKTWVAQPFIAGLSKPAGEKVPVTNPYNGDVVGEVVRATVDEMKQALEAAVIAQPEWNAQGATHRADILDNIAHLLEAHTAEFIYLAIKEAGKTIPDAVAEVREAVDFCRYYAHQARTQLSQPLIMQGPTGEHNELQLHGRGTFVCISPWNFPLAIFTGQVVAALVTGNAVLAKPADQTPLIAAYAVHLFHQAGVPEAVMQLIPGRGSVIGQALIADERVKGVMFTGSTEVAKVIQRTLADRPGDIVPFIAETGGQNCMIVDSSALPEQVVDDVIRSAFGSAGQRCSALRVLYLQEDIADKTIDMLIGAMKTLRLNDPSLLSSDVGPVIDEKAQQTLQAHIDTMQQQAKCLYQIEPEAIAEAGHFIAPVAFEIESIAELEREVFGPVLHVIRFKLDALDDVIQDINSTGYGLTFGMHSRVESRVRYVQQRIHAGNAYINRNTIGAVVGVQPFGGEGLSGTGPKAGGPHYLPRLCVERTLSVNTTATGGNASLLSLSE